MANDKQQLTQILTQFITRNQENQNHGGSNGVQSGEVVYPIF
jgi:hypothetical protein